MVRRPFIGIWSRVVVQTVASSDLLVGDFHDITVESTLPFGCKISYLRLRTGTKSGWNPNYSELGAPSSRYLDFSLLLRRVQGVYKGCPSGVPALILCSSGVPPLYTPCTRLVCGCFGAGKEGDWARRMVREDWGNGGESDGGFGECPIIGHFRL